MKQRKPMKPGKPLARKTGIKAKSGLKPATKKMRVAPKYDPTVQPARDLLRARSMGFCEIDGKNEATDWHHRMNRSVLGKWDASNGLHLCRLCHTTVTETKPEWFANGWCVKSWDNPADIPVLLFDGWALLADDGTAHHLTPAELDHIRREAA